jgi:serine/threonine protein kinase
VARRPLQADDPRRIGHYRLTARLGVGGMGVVYLGVGWDGSQVAVKLLRPELADDQEFRRRFSREVAALVQVKGKCTVRVIEADSQSPRPFLVTEYAEGPSLAEHINTHKMVGPDMLYDLATGLAEALTTIHAAGIMHRDLKPSNIILTQAGPKVIDFGIARRQDTPAMTETGMVVGSLGFMAPEQISGHAGPAADIFAWGLTVGYAAAGQPPFGTGNAHAILYQIMYGAPDIAAVPELLRPMVAAALAKDPENRPTARLLLDRLTSLSPQPGRAGDAATQVFSSPTWQTGLHSGPPAAQAADAAAGPLPAAAGGLLDVETAPSAAAPSFLAPAAAAPAGPPAQQRTPGIQVSRRTVTIAVSAIVLIAVIVAVVALTTHSL